MFKCQCGRYSNFGTTCSFCAKDVEMPHEEVDELLDVFYLIDKADRDELGHRLSNTRWR